MGDESDSTMSFPTGKSAQERGLSYVPECYMVPDSYRPSSSQEIANDLPVVDLAGLRLGSGPRSLVIESIRNACRCCGFFQVINHGICQSILDDAISSAFDFFGLPSAEKMKFASKDVHKPVRYGTSFKEGIDKTQFWRVFLKHYAYPLEDWIHLWPTKPPTYREKMGKYCTEVRKLSLELMSAIAESLGLGPFYLQDKLKSGMQVISVNCYPPCPHPGLTLGLPPHSDYSCLTILLQTSPGLQIMHPAGSPASSWKLVPSRSGVLQVNLGDHLEAMSNGIYKSVVHRATLSRDIARVSIASFHSLGMDDTIGAATQLVDEKERPNMYRESSVRDFLNFLANTDVAEGNKTFLDTIKIANPLL